MKIEFNLTPHHKLILRILHESGRGITYDEFSRVVDAINAGDSDFSKFIKIIVGPYYPMLPVLGSTPDLLRDIDGLEFVGLLSVLSRHNSIPNEIKLTEEGKRVAKSLKEERRVIIRPRPALRTAIFVACALGDDEIEQLYGEALAPACRAQGYEPVRVDMSEPPQTITELMMEAITEAACVLADLTHARPSVYFEAGYAHGLGVPLLLTCREDHHRGSSDDARIHFDLEQYKISYWSRTPEGKFSWPKGMEPAERLALIIPHRDKKS